MNKIANLQTHTKYETLTELNYNGPVSRITKFPFFFSKNAGELRFIILGRKMGQEPFTTHTTHHTPHCLTDYIRIPIIYWHSCFNVEGDQCLRKKGMKLRFACSSIIFLMGELDKAWQANPWQGENEHNGINVGSIRWASVLERKC